MTAAGVDEDPAAPRRRDAAATRRALVAAARTLIGEHGVEGASTREVAAAAGVNQALVYRYFGSKEKLFAEAAGQDSGAPGGTGVMAETPLDVLPRTLLEGALDDGGRSLERDLMAVLLGGANDDAIRAVVRSRIDELFGGTLAARLSGPGAELRAELFAAILAGVTLLREKIGTGALTRASRAEIGDEVDRLAAVLFDDRTG